MIAGVEENKVKYPLGSAASIGAMTFGEPGNRTFKLDASSGAASCSIWMEKEQLLQLGVYLRDMIGRLSQDERDKGSDLREEAWSGGDLTVEFKAGQMLLSYDQDSNAFYLQAYEREAEEQEASSGGYTTEVESVGFWITIEQACVLGEESLKICAAGRPTCFLCGQPINPDGHACPRANGHTVLEAG